VNDSKTALVRIVVFSLLFPVFWGVAEAQDFGHFAFDQHKAEVVCVGTTSSPPQTFCGMVEWQVQKRFPIAVGREFASYKIVVGQHSVASAGEDEVLAVFAVLLRQIAYPFPEDDSSRLADHFVSMWIGGKTSDSTYMENARSAAEDLVLSITNDIAAIKR